MSAKIDRVLTRKEAQQEYVRLRIEDIEKIKREFLAEAMGMRNRELERDLEELNDQHAEGGFYKYQIRG